MSLELLGHVPDHAGHIPSVPGCREVATCPSDRTRDAPVCAGCGYALYLANEVADSRVGAERDAQMYVVAQHGAAQQADTTRTTRGCDCAANVACRRLVDTADSIPCMEGDVGVELVGVMTGHDTESMTDPGREPGVAASGRAVLSASSGIHRKIDAGTVLARTESLPAVADSRLYIGLSAKWHAAT